jgi:hypothetical protein
VDVDIEQIMREATRRIIQETASAQNLAKLTLKHRNKIHFVPVKYRVLGGLLQALNIKFGAFVEELLVLVVERDANVHALPESGQKIRFSMTARTDALIDQYITSRQLPGRPNTCDQDFKLLLDQIVTSENQQDEPKQTITKDVDALFRTRQGVIVYLELKYNDDHDTGKFVDINRKFIKTYAGLVNHLAITHSEDLKPILYYFNPTLRWGPVFVPDDNIYRGSRLFDEYFETGYAEIEQHLMNISIDDDILAMLDEVYRKIRYDD